MRRAWTPHRRSVTADLRCWGQVRDMCLNGGFYLFVLPVIDGWAARKRARCGDRDGAIPQMRAAIADLFRSGQLGSCVPATGVLVEILLDRSADGDVAEAEAAIERLASAPADEGLATREIWLLRLSGLFPDLRSCAECGTELDDTTPIFVDAELNSRCTQCRPNVPSVFSLEILGAVRASYQLSPLNFVKNRKLTDQEDSILSALTHRLITRAIDRRPRTLVAANR